MGCSKSNNRETKPFKMEIYTFTQLKDMIAKGRNVLVYENMVIDVEKWINQHPGVPLVIKPLLGLEISRYFYGGFIAPGQSKPRVHSENACKVIQQYQIGIIDSGVNIFMMPPNTELQQLTWQLVRKAPITNVHNRFFFQCPNVKTKNILPGIGYAGKYFTLCHVKSNQKRNFGLFFTATEKLLPEYLKLIKAVTNGDDWVPPFENINEVFRDGMEFFMKKKEGFSKLVSEISLPGEPSFDVLNCQFKIKGPFGIGLRLSPSPKGLIVAAICGTSIAMWLEVVAYMIRKAAYQAGCKSGKDYRLFKNETFEDLNEPNFKLILFSSFGTLKESLGKDVFDVLHSLSKSLGLNNFEYYLRVSENAEPHYTEEYFKERIKGTPERIYFWGPYGVAPALREIFLKMGYSEDMFYNT